MMAMMPGDGIDDDAENDDSVDEEEDGDEEKERSLYD
jgi:hypothetical protein